VKDLFAFSRKHATKRRGFLVSVTEATSTSSVESFSLRLLITILPSFVIFNLSFLICPAIALQNEFIVDADNISYAKEQQKVEASGSVEVSYKDIRITGNRLLYDVSAETVAMQGSVEVFYQDTYVRAGKLFYWASREAIDADDGFYFQYEGISIEGRSLAYELKSKAGKAKEIKFNFQEVDLTGSEMSFNPDTFDLRSASFTTCDFQFPHYHVTAGEILFYPRSKWLVAYWGYFWLANIPIVPMPTYIYDLSAQEKGNRNLPPFPQVGSNGEDGSYLNETLAWHLNRNFSGTYSLGYAERKGLLLGLNVNYMINDANKGNLRLGSSGLDGESGGITHTFSFGEVVPRKSFVLFSQPVDYRYSLETTVSHRERVNYQRVSFLPNVRFFSRSQEIFRQEAKIDLDLTTGVIDEENNQRLGRNGINLKLFGDFTESPIGFIIPALNFEGNYYADGTKWEKPAFGLEIIKKINPLVEVEAGYAHYLYVNGTSPFNYERYRFRPADRGRASLTFDLDRIAARVAGSYFLDNWTAEDLDYTLFFKFHCYNLEVTYRSIRREFLLGFSLAARNN